MSTETGKNRPEQAGKNTDHSNSSYAMPEELSDALQKLIIDQLMKVQREVRSLDLDPDDGTGSAVGWEDMPPAAREFHARSEQDVADEDLGAVVTDG